MRLVEKLFQNWEHLNNTERLLLPIISIMLTVFLISKCHGDIAILNP